VLPVRTERLGSGARVEEDRSLQRPGRESLTEVVSLRR
jgi:hypothetical protein